jgi:hypothetical protein
MEKFGVYVQVIFIPWLARAGNSFREGEEKRHADTGDPKND